MSVEGHSWVDATRTAHEPQQAATPGHLLLIEIADFVALRRLLGVARADLLTLDVAERVAALLPDATVATAGRNLLELTIAGTGATCLHTTLATLHRAFEQPIAIDGKPHNLCLHIGSASAAPGDSDEVDIVERAEQSLVRARDGGSNRAERAAVLVDNDDAEVGRHLRQAIERSELFMQYQPKLHLRKQRVVSVEALIRWQHPRRGLVLPNDFITLAERTGDIAAVTLWTIRQVMADQRVMVRNGHDLPVFINMAGALLSDAAFVDQVIALIGDNGPRLGVEITETSVIRDPDGAIRHLQRLADIGVVITIDDYGAGLSSLAYLKQLPASELKIDKLFVTQLTSSHRDPLIVRSTIDLAHALEMEVVAEGVETAASLALLSVMGCDMVQGFLISRPLGLEALLTFLQDDNHAAFALTARSPLERLAAVRARG
jgi:EAL domain-containing protein (putative c-di-GMP-specific phosphodiesterase class I)/GGDEF domain-containing protein